MDDNKFTTQNMDAMRSTMKRSGYLSYNLNNFKKMSVKERSTIYSGIKKGMNKTGGNWGGKEKFYNGQ